MNKPITQLTGTDILNLLKTIDKDTWIKIGGACLVLAVVGYFFIWPTWFKRSEIKGRIAAVEGQIVRLQTQRRNEKDWLAQKEEYANYIAEVKKRLYVPGETSLLLGYISRLATESDVSVIASTPRSEKREFPKPYNDLYTSEFYDFTIEGGYHELGHFISRIESNPKIMKVELFKIAPREEEGEKHIADLTVSAVSWRKKPE